MHCSIKFPLSDMLNRLNVLVGTTLGDIDVDGKNLANNTWEQSDLTQNQAPMTINLC